METLKYDGMTLLSEEEISETDGGVLGTAIAIGMTAYRIYRIPGVKDAVNTGATWVGKGVSAYLGYKATTGWGN